MGLQQRTALFTIWAGRGTLHSIFRAVLNDVWSLKKFNGTGLSGKDNASTCARSYKIYDMHFRVDRGGGAPPMTSQFRVWNAVACHMTCAHSSALSFAYTRC